MTGHGPTQPDRWSQWLLEQRDAGDARQREVALTHLAPIRDRVLAGAEPLEGATLLDLGTGEWTTTVSATIAGVSAMASGSSLSPLA
jgi:hypothetical protein